MTSYTDLLLGALLMLATSTGLLLAAVTYFLTHFGGPPRRLRHVTGGDIRDVSPGAV